MSNPALIEAIFTLNRPRYLTDQGPMRQFDALRHTLYNLSQVIKDSSTRDKLDDEDKENIQRLLRNLILECAPRAPLLYEVILILGIAERRLRDERLDLVQYELEKVSSELRSLENAPRDLVYKLCLNHRPPNGDVQFQIHPWSLIDHYRPYSPPLSFDLGELRMLAAALRANAHRAGRHPAPCCLRYEEFQNGEIRTTVVTWLEHSKWELLKKEDPSESYKAIIEQVKKSAHEKGLSRGLPQVILFGIENEASTAEVYVRNQWIRLWADDERTSFPEGVLSVDEGFDKDTLPNYGWRFLFQSQDDKEEGENRPENFTLPGAEIVGTTGDNVEDRLVVLVDDNRNASWLRNIHHRLITAHNFRREEVVILSPEGETPEECIGNWTIKIGSLVSESDSNDCDVVTDSQIDSASNGGETLLLKLAEEKLISKGLIYSMAPRLDKAKFNAYPNVIIRELRKDESNYADDASQIAHFLREGELNPLASLIEMLRRFVATIESLLKTAKNPPWALFRTNAPDQDNWRIKADHWRLLANGLGEGVPAPFSASTWRLFTNKPFREFIQIRFRDRGQGLDLANYYSELLRQVFCPVDSVVQAVEVARERKPWLSRRSLGSIRAMWDLTVNEQVYLSEDPRKFEAWSKGEANALGHKEIGLKYRHYLYRFREEVVRKIVIDDWNQICDGARRQIPHVKEFLEIWG